MKQEKIAINYTVLQEEELNVADRNILVAAREAAKNAYSPYSQFCVGAAVLLDSNKIITGSNQEVANFISGSCAEMVALNAAGNQYPKNQILKIAVSAKKGGFNDIIPVSPCGSCRQIMVEFEKRNKQAIEIILEGTNGSIILLHSAKDLLPFTFSLNTL